MVDDPDICFNYGVALSELGRVEESLVPLNKCLKLDPSYDNAAIAIGVSLSKLHRYDEAEVVLKAAAKIQPDNALVKQNLAATLARSGKYAEALPYFRQAASLAPDNPAVLMGLAHCLDSMDAHRKEVLKVYKDVVRRFPDSQFAEDAKQILNRAGQVDLRKVVDDGYRPDAVEYMIGAMKRFAETPREQVGRVADAGRLSLVAQGPVRRCLRSRKPGSWRRRTKESYYFVTIGHSLTRSQSSCVTSQKFKYSATTSYVTDGFVKLGKSRARTCSTRPLKRIQATANSIASTFRCPTP